MLVSTNDISWLCELAAQASEIILSCRSSSHKLQVQHKSDKTPVTKADQQASAAIVAALRQRWPDVPIISEEEELADYSERCHWPHYWLVDPLDGTRGFIQGSDEFTVNIALIESGVPTVGIIMAPVSAVTWVGMPGRAAYCFAADGIHHPLQAKDLAWQELRVVTGRFHAHKRLKALFDLLPGCKLQQQNSSLKFVTIATGDADFYPRFGPIYEWDIAAGHAILQAAGGCVLDLSGQDLQYNKKSSMLASPFIAMGHLASRRELENLLRELGDLL